jgi:hypothetical protein
MNLEIPLTICISVTDNGYIVHLPQTERTIVYTEKTDVLQCVLTALEEK